MSREMSPLYTSLPTLRRGPAAAGPRFMTPILLLRKSPRFAHRASAGRPFPFEAGLPPPSSSPLQNVTPLYLFTNAQAGTCCRRSPPFASFAFLAVALCVTVFPFSSQQLRAALHGGDVILEHQDPPPQFGRRVLTVNRTNLLFHHIMSFHQNRMPRHSESK